MNTQLLAGQPIPLTPDGNWLYLKSAKAEIEIYRESSGERVTLGKSSVFNVGEGKHLGRLLISSRTDNEIEVQFGFGMFTPPVEGQSVVVQALPAVAIAEHQQIGVSQLPAVELAPNQQLEVTALPLVTLEPDQVIKVNEQASDNLITEVVTTFPHHINSNTTRKAITIKAARTNAGSVFVDAFELEAGERIEIASTAAMTLTGFAVDKVTIMEI
ncbi:hypothetical protein ACP3VW_09645 [Vibrio sp. DNB22_17_1]